MVLVDTSVWVKHFQEGDLRLQELLSDAEIASHPFVIGELACGNIKNRGEILSLLQSLPIAQPIDLAEFLYFVEENGLMGTGIGFIDIHLLASAKLSGIPLWTFDKKLRAAAMKLDVAYQAYSR